MANLGGINIHNPERTLYAGGAFLLSQPSELSATVLLPRGAEVEISEGNPYAVARVNNAPEDHIFERSYSALQEGLDWLSVTGKADLSILDAEDEHLLWWEAGGGHIRVVSTSTLTFSVPPARLRVEGREVEEPDDTSLPATSEHPGFRYYRLAQITEDLHDAYRNMYLAFEVTLSREYPLEDREWEREWIYRAIADAEAELNLSGLLDLPPGEVPGFVYKRLYKDGRLPLFHAKYDRDYYAPQSIQEDRQVVAEALAKLTRIVLRMFEVWHDARRRGGGVFLGWVYERVRASMSDAHMVVSDHQDVDSSESDLSHERFNIGVRTSELEISSDSRGRPVIVGSVDSAALEHLPTVRCIDIINDEAPLMAHVLEAGLDMTGLEDLQFVAKVQVANANQPKTLFKT